MVESTQTSPEIQRLSAGFPSIPRSKHWTQCLQRIVPYGITGHVRSIRGTTVVVDGLPVPVGSLVRVVFCGCFGFARDRKQNRILKDIVVGRAFRGGGF